MMMFRSMFTLLLLLIVSFCIPASGKDLDELQVIAIEGRFLDPAGKSVEEYDYLESGQKYRLLPGAKVNLSTLDGTKIYLTEGPGILSYDDTGRVTLNGRALTPSKLESSLKDVSATGIQRADLGGIAMRSREGVQVMAKTVDGGSKVIPLYSGYHALVIGCGDYRKGWPRLPNPVEDAQEVANLLKGMGWHVTLLKDPDWATLRKGLNSLITGPGRDKDKAILVWFSGHGHTLAEADGARLGYIVPVDAPDPDRDEMGFMEHAISMRQVETVARRIKSKHVMMMFDSCFSGAIFQITRAKPPPFIEEKVARPVRQFLTAGSDKEQVPDKSFFKTVFIQGVGDRDADRNKDGYITGQELGAYLQEKVVNYSRKAQHPQYGKINNPKLDKGDFVFTARPLPTQIPPKSVDTGPTRAALVKTKPSGPKLIAEEPIVGELRVTSNVDGAQFRLAGRDFKTKRGSALIVGGVPAGEHEVVARKKGYAEWKGRIRVKTDQMASLAIRLEDMSENTRELAEKSVLETVKGWADAWNRRDQTMLLGLFTDRANIMTKTPGGNRVLSKHRFSQILDKKMRWVEQRGIKYKITEMRRFDFQGRRAVTDLSMVVQIPGHSPPGVIDHRPVDRTETMECHFVLIKKDRQWLIHDFRFDE
ncbi:MAG: caspase family protein [Deltaproteobacteria bacterium]|nr:caspase family protein [Deltaproteobacteria bacterium]